MKIYFLSKGEKHALARKNMRHSIRFGNAPIFCKINKNKVIRVTRDVTKELESPMLENFIELAESLKRWKQLTENNGKSSMADAEEFRKLVGRIHSLLKTFGEQAHRGRYTISEVRGKSSHLYYVQFVQQSRV